MPCLYYIVPRAKAVLLCTENTSLNKTGNQFSQIVFIMFLALLTLSREIFLNPVVKNEVFICKQENTGKEKRQLLEVQGPLHCSGKELISDGCPGC